MLEHLRGLKDELGGFDKGIVVFAFQIGANMLMQPYNADVVLGCSCDNFFQIGFRDAEFTVWASGDDFVVFPCSLVGVDADENLFATEELAVVADGVECTDI
jgi:hypothetical protein